MIFGMLNPEKIWHERLTHLPTSPVRCSHFTLGNPNKSVSTVLFVHTSDYLCYLRRKQTVTHLPTPPVNVTTLTCEMLNFFICMKVCCVPSNVGALKRTSVMCSNWNISGKQRHSKCSQWPPSTWIHASSLFSSDQSHLPPLKFNPCRNKLPRQLVRIADWYSIQTLLLQRAPDEIIGLCR